ncbi:hypothetical protein PPYR_14494 [Photinus pyralis]|uniref:RRM domain-containing protein n=2 Tax=Photinus pyralis TaxID=7054 RepID=A0A5N4A5D5_PHOPY|nr:hypothetical protein PPYR_14494 [Photinus pyralis]
MKPPPLDNQVFVKDLPIDALEDEIFVHFSRAGQIYEIILMVDPDSEGVHNLGCAFIRYVDSEGAKNAVRHFHNFPFRLQRRVVVVKAIASKRVYIFGLPFSKCKTQIWDELIRKGLKNITDVIVHKPPATHKKNRGFIFVEFETHENAAFVRNKYYRNNPLHLFGRKCLVDWTSTTMTVDSEAMADVKRLFMRNLPRYLSRKDILEILYKLIDDMCCVEKIYKANQFAFIHFGTREMAETALLRLKRYFENTDVEITWCIPQEEEAKLEKTFRTQQKMFNILYLSSFEENYPLFSLDCLSSDSSGSSEGSSSPPRFPSDIVASVSQFKAILDSEQQSQQFRIESTYVCTQANEASPSESCCNISKFPLQQVVESLKKNILPQCEPSTSKSAQEQSAQEQIMAVVEGSEFAMPPPTTTWRRMDYTRNFGAPISGIQQPTEPSVAMARWSEGESAASSNEGLPSMINWWDLLTERDG